MLRRHLEPVEALRPVTKDAEEAEEATAHAHRLRPQEVTTLDRMNRQEKPWEHRLPPPHLEEKMHQRWP